MSKINHFKKCKLPNIISSNHVLVLVHIFVYDRGAKKKRRKTRTPHDSLSIEKKEMRKGRAIALLSIGSRNRAVLKIVPS
jgi:hypothetical protein